MECESFCEGNREDGVGRRTYSREILLEMSAGDPEKRDGQGRIPHNA